MIIEWLGQEDVVVTTVAPPTVTTVVPSSALSPQLRPVYMVQEEKKSKATPWIIGGLVLVGGVLAWRWLA